MTENFEKKWYNFDIAIEHRFLKEVKSYEKINFIETG